MAVQTYLVSGTPSQIFPDSTAIGGVSASSFTGKTLPEKCTLLPLALSSVQDDLDPDSWSSIRFGGWRTDGPKAFPPCFKRRQGAEAPGFDDVDTSDSEGSFRLDDSLRTDASASHLRVLDT